MAWEIISSFIQKKAESYKKNNGGIISIGQLEDYIQIIYNDVKSKPDWLEFFENEKDNWIDKITSRLKSIIATTAESDNILSGDDNFERWIIPERIEADDWNYWNRYKSYLREIGRPIDVIENTTKSTFDIIERLGDPKSDIKELQKGLVLGAVQSGKTANFNGVINRAIDLGYDLIIVLSGIMNDLRIQTQKRINNDVIGIGYDETERNNQPLGVGKSNSFSNNSNVYQIESITSENYDFKKAHVDSNITNPKIMVCKKNHSVLANILNWIKTSIPESQEVLFKSILILDDEADNASLNNLGYRGIEYANKINGHIRALLNLFNRRSYLGYTATPFANILQDQNAENNATDAWKIKFRDNGQIKTLSFTLSPSLFPDNFIYKLNSPTNYVGPNQFFSYTNINVNDKKIPLLVIIEDGNIPNIEDDEKFFGLSASIRDAIDCFILSIALRESRNDILKDLPGYTQHHSMLVHTSRLISDQNILAEHIKKYVESLKNKINQDGLTDENGIYKSLELQWNRFFEYQVKSIKDFLPEGYNTDGLQPAVFENILKLLPHAISKVEVKAINSQTGEKLEYNRTGEGKKYLAIGGNRLSRGFTLEGLTINYFLRNTNYYDALLQMGRWFGYRPGYIDACRLFIDKDTEDKYDFINETLHELELQIESMEAQNRTPKEFELRIKKHPNVLKITRNSILRNAVNVRFSFQDSVQQSTVFTLSPDKVDQSWKEFTNLYDSFEWIKDDTDGFYKISTNVENLFKFLDISLTFSSANIDTDNIKRYIGLFKETNVLKTWIIAIKKTGEGSALKYKDLEINKTKRSGPDKINGKFFQPLRDQLEFTASQKSKNIITAGTDESLGLDPSIKNAAEIAFRNHKADKYKKDGITDDLAIQKANKTTIPGYVYRKVRSPEKGLLLIYLMDLEQIFNCTELQKSATEKGLTEDLRRQIPLIGYALSFPVITNDPGGDYVANEIIAEINEDEEVDNDIVFVDEIVNVD